MENSNLMAKTIEAAKSKNTAINSASSTSTASATAIAMTAAAISTSTATATTNATTTAIATSFTINDTKAKADIPTPFKLQAIPPCAAACAANSNIGMVLPSSNVNKKPSNCRERLQLNPFTLMTNSSHDESFDAKDKMDLPEGWVLKQGDLQKLRNPQDLDEIVIFERKITVESSTPSPASTSAASASIPITSTVSTSAANASAATASATTASASSSAITSKDSEKQTKDTQLKDTKNIQEKLTLAQVMLSRKTYTDSKTAAIKISLMFKSPSLVIKSPFQSLYDKIDATVYAAEPYHATTMPSFDDNNHLFVFYRIGEMSELHAKAWFDVLINEGFLKEDAAAFFQTLTRDPVSSTDKEKLATIAHIILNKEFLKYPRALEIAKSIHTAAKSPDHRGDEDSATIAYEMGLKLAEDSIENAILSFKIIQNDSFLRPLALEQIAILYTHLSQDTHLTIDERREHLEKALKCYMRLSGTYNFNLPNKAGFQQCISTLVPLIKKHAALAPHESLLNNFNIESLFSNRSQKIRHGQETIFEKLGVYLEIFIDLANNIYQSINPSKSTEFLDKKTTLDKSSTVSATVASATAASAPRSTASASMEKDSKHAKDQFRTENFFKPFNRDERNKQEAASRTFRYSKALVLQANSKENSEQSQLARAVIYKQILGYDDEVQGFMTTGKKSSTLVLVFRKPNNASLNQHFEAELWNKLCKINGTIEWYSCNHLHSNLYFTWDEAQQLNSFWTFYINVGSMTESIANDFFNALVLENYITQSEANMFKSKFSFKPSVVTQAEHNAIQTAWNTQQFDEAIKLARQVHQTAIAQNHSDFPWKQDLDDAEVAYELGLGFLSAGQPEKAIEVFEILKVSSPFYHAAQEQIALANKASNSRESELAQVKSSFRKLLADLLVNGTANDESLQFFLDGLEKYAGFNVYDTKKRLYTERFQFDPIEDPLFINQIMLPLSNYLFSLKNTPTPTTAIAAKPPAATFLPSGGPQTVVHAVTSTAATASTTNSADKEPNKYK